MAKGGNGAIISNNIMLVPEHMDAFLLMGLWDDFPAELGTVTTILQCE